MFRIITIPFSFKEEGFSDKELNDFIVNKKGIQYKAELIKINDKYYWSVFLTYEEEVSEKMEYKFKFDYEKAMYQKIKN
jgi:hypothetical protein